MEPDEPTLSALEPLTTSADIRDRAFAASALGLRRGDREQVAALYERVCHTAALAHADQRQRIRDGTLDKRALIAELQAMPNDVRDHFVEELLGVAYPPLELGALPTDAVAYTPSGLSEVLFTLAHADLDPSKTFVDLGAGLGKVVLLVALLSGARACGIEIDHELVSRAERAAQSLELNNARFVAGDMRTIAIPPADVYYLFIPLTQCGELVARLEPTAVAQKSLIFAQTLDLGRLPWLRRCNASSYWLEKYAAV